jgi:hypothetical protein
VTAESAGHHQGTTFTVGLPLTATRPPANHLLHAPGLDQSASDKAGELKGVRVLLVEDELDMRTLLGLMLERAGAEVAVTGTAEEALAQIVEFNPDLLLSDIGLPVEDGYELIRKLRASPLEALKQIPAIALTAYVTDKDRELALAAGYHIHLAKPVEASELIDAVAQLAGAKGAA